MLCLVRLSYCIEVSGLFEMATHCVINLDLSHNEILDSEGSIDSSVESSESEDDDAAVNPVWAAHTSGLRQIPFTGNNSLLVPIPGDN